jgi:MoaA/NifB/PqqE/SkfB family radical SAM enzyme
MIFNFAHRCNMACEWCYIPFGGSQPTPDLCRCIVERIADIGFEVVTFGGGDPMMYSFMPELISVAKARGLFVHVDTNGIGLRCNDTTMRLLSSQIDLIGFPLDGPDASTHNNMRSSAAHFDLLLSKLKWALPLARSIKINTLVTAQNANVVAKMGELIREIAPARWSLYQYWPLSNGALSAARHRISDQNFYLATKSLPTQIGPTYVELNPLSARRLTYPFVSQDGTVYCHDLRNLDAYEGLGSVFDDAAMLEVMKRCGSERPEATARYSR